MNQTDIEDLKFLDAKNLDREKPILKGDLRELGEFLLEDDPKKISVPEEFRKRFWIVFDKELALSNFDKDDVKRLMFSLDIIKLDVLIGTPDFEVSFEDMMQFDEIEMKAFVKIMRSTGGVNRERSLLTTQIKQFLTRSMDQPKGGFLSKFGAMLPGRKK